MLTTDSTDIEQASWLRQNQNDVFDVESEGSESDWEDFEDDPDDYEQDAENSEDHYYWDSPEGTDQTVTLEESQPYDSWDDHHGVIEEWADLVVNSPVTCSVLVHLFGPGGI